MDCLKKVFGKFNENNIKYVVLRGYLELEDFYSTDGDVDIFIDADDFLLTKEILTKLGWKSEVVKTGRVPHTFFRFHASEGDSIILDVVTEIFLSAHLMKYAKSKDILGSGYMHNEGFKVPNISISLLYYIVRLVFDKKTLSNKNQQRLKLLWECYCLSIKKGNIEPEMNTLQTYYSIKIEKLINAKNEKEIKKMFEELRKISIGLNLLQYSLWRDISNNLGYFIRLILYKIRKVLGFKNIK